MIRWPDPGPGSWSQLSHGNVSDLPRFLIVPVREYIGWAKNEQTILIGKKIFQDYVT